MNDNKLKRVYPFLISAAGAAAFFVSLFGFSVLNPQNTAWLRGGNDLCQHFLGWEAFRRSPWMFPIGMTNALSYPEEVSVIFTDSIPLLALPCKLLSFMLPVEFQYFGLWCFACFILQALLSARLFSRFTGDPFCIVLASWLFLPVPILLYRMFFHCAVCAQWILFPAFEMFFSGDEMSFERKVKIWTFLGFLVSLIHFYLVPMLGLLLIACVVKDLIRNRDSKKPLWYFPALCLPILINTFLLGGFSSGVHLGDEGLGRFNMNLNAFLNPLQFSSFLQALPLVSEEQQEGLAYPGLGVYLAILAAVLFLIRHGKKKIISENRKEYILPMALFFSLNLILVTIPVITLNEKQLLSIPMPGLLFRLLSVFRANGRLIWPSVYMLMFVPCLLIIRCFDKRNNWEKGMISIAGLLLSCCLTLQLLDVYPQLASVRQRMQNLNSGGMEGWNHELYQVIGEQGIKHLYLSFLPDMYELMQIADSALLNGCSLNRFYFARSVPEEELQEAFDLAIASPGPEDAFLFSEYNKLLYADSGLHFYAVAGHYLGSAKPLHGLPEVFPAKEASVYRFHDGKYLVKGEDQEDKRVIWPGGYSYGPGWDLPPGRYRIAINGNVSRAGYSLFSEGKALEHAFEVIDANDDRTLLEVSFDRPVKGLETIVTNYDNDTYIILYSISLTKEQENKD